jgi:hypothetical protein
LVIVTVSVVTACIYLGEGKTDQHGDRSNRARNRDVVKVQRWTMNKTSCDVSS